MTSYVPLVTVVAWSLLLPYVSLVTAEAQPAQARDAVAFYIAIYGEVRPEQDPRVAMAHRVFERVRATADKNSKRLPRLVVVNSRADPWAIALPAGDIVLSKQAVAICHEQVNPAEAEARLAFVLGHELAHLAHDDFWHHEVHSFLATHTDTRPLAAFLGGHRATKERELEADDKGFIYAALAGYPVERLLKPGAGSTHFFHFWTQQTNTQVQSARPSAGDRAALLQQRLRNLNDKLGFFEFGVRLSHFDYCDDGVYFFQEFQKVFPGREVLNNLGYCYLQMARQGMDAARAYFYWLPLILDGETRAQALVRDAAPRAASLKSLKQDAAGRTEGFLQEAVEHLKRAVEADPAYVPARLNLAVAYLYLGRPQQASAVLSDAHGLWADELSLQGLKALSLYESSDAGLDLWPMAVAKLEKLVASPDAPPALLFNLARLLAVRSGAREADDYWNRLAVMGERLPATIRVFVCQEQSAMPAASCLGRTSQDIERSPWTWPLPRAGLERLSPEAERTTLQGWQATPFDWFKDKLHGHIYRRPDGVGEVLEIDQFVQMQVLRGESLGSVRALAAYCGQPLRQRTLSNGMVWSCADWAALALGDQVRELWWVAR
jgi:tetratricopeptide (TPR) repeat protein